MTDIFQEVEEEVRRERVEQLWKKYGDYVVAAGAAVVIAIAGYELWLRYDANERAKASAQYDAAMQVAMSNPVQGANRFDRLAQTAPAGYAVLSKFAEADASFASGNTNKALALFKAIAKDDKSVVGEAARMRAAWILADNAPRSQLEQLLAPLTVSTSPWRFLAREVLAHADYRVGDLARAETDYEGLANDMAAPQSLRTRARIMAEFVRAGGEGNYGTVPALPAPKTPQAPSATAPSAAALQQGPSPR